MSEDYDMYLYVLFIICYESADVKCLQIDSDFLQIGKLGPAIPRSSPRQFFDI